MMPCARSSRTPTPCSRIRRAPSCSRLPCANGARRSRADESFGTHRFAPAPITEDEAARLTAPDPLLGAPEHVAADIPEWTLPHLKQSFGDTWLAEAQALSARPPLDLRVNTLKSSRDKVLRSIDHLSPDSEDRLPLGIRFAPGGRDSRTPNVQIEEAYLTGGFEIQDFGSQIVATLAVRSPTNRFSISAPALAARRSPWPPRCRTRARSSPMTATARDLHPSDDRLTRAGVRNAQVRPPRSGSLTIFRVSSIAW